MSDDIDRANNMADFERDFQLKHRASANIEAGRPGECVTCGYESPRLVSGMCVDCRNVIERLNKRGFSTL